MTPEEIRGIVRQSVIRVTGNAPGEIDDASSYREALGLDSLSALEIMVDVEYAFKIKIPEERMQEIKSIDDTVRVVQEYLSAAKP